jgi:hypothetical protein
MAPPRLPRMNRLVRRPIVPTLMGQIGQVDLWQGAIAGRNLEARPVQTVCSKPGAWPACFGLTEAAHKAVELRG